MNNKTLAAVLFLLSSAARADEPTWGTRVVAAMDPLPVGYCVAVRLELSRNDTREMPRDRQGMLMNMTNFDIAVEGAGAAGKPNGPGYYNICGCQGGAPGGTVTVTATYPASSLPEAKRWPRVSFQTSTTVTLAPPKTTVNPPACAGLVTNGATPGSISNAAGGAPSAAGALAGAVGAAAAPGAPAATSAPQTEATRGVTSLGQTNSIGTTLLAQLAAGQPPPTTAPPSTSTTTTATPATPPASSAPPTSTPPPAAAPATNRYLVTITGLRVYQASADDMLSRDGVGDEVYASAYVRNYDRRTGQLASVAIRTSASHGDVFHFGQQRLQAGTRSATGGLRDGDMIPDGALLAVRSVPAQATTFPMRIFEGALADGVDALLISPSIWEQDGTNAYFTQWQQNQAFLNNVLFAKQGVHDEIDAKTFKPLRFGMSGNDANTAGTSIAHTITDTMIMMGGGGIPIVGLLSQSGDRPLGLQESGRDQTALPNHVIVLTREIIEAALARPALGMIVSPVANGPSGGLLGTPAIARVGVIAQKPGILVLQFEDRNVSGTLAFPERPAIYQMYIQAERVP